MAYNLLYKTMNQKTCKHCEQPRAHSNLCRLHWAAYQRTRRRTRKPITIPDDWSRMKGPQREMALKGWLASSHYIEDHIAQACLIHFEEFEEYIENCSTKFAQEKLKKETPPGV